MVLESVNNTEINHTSITVLCILKRYSSEQSHGSIHVMFFLVDYGLVLLD